MGHASSGLAGPGNAGNERMAEEAVADDCPRQCKSRSTGAVVSPKATHAGSLHALSPQAAQSHPWTGPPYGRVVLRSLRRLVVHPNAFHTFFAVRF